MDIIERKKDLLKRKATKLLKSLQSEASKKAHILVNEETKLQDETKNMCKELDIYKIRVEIDEKVYILEFEPRMRRVLDKTLVPEEIIEQCTVEQFSWYKKIYEISPEFL